MACEVKTEIAERKGEKHDRILPCGWISGASSGRHILGHLEDGRMVLEEVYRFPTCGMKKHMGICAGTRMSYFPISKGGMKRL